MIALLFAIVYYMCRRLVSFKEAMNCLTQGFIAMVPAMLILTFAVTLKTMTGLLGADVYVAGLMQGASTGLTNMLPAIIFLVACFLEMCIRDREMAMATDLFVLCVKMVSVDKLLENR